MTSTSEWRFRGYSQWDERNAAGFPLGVMISAALSSDAGKRPLRGIRRQLVAASTHTPGQVLQNGYLSWALSQRFCGISGSQLALGASDNHRISRLVAEFIEGPHNAPRCLEFRAAKGSNSETIAYARVGLPALGVVTLCASHHRQHTTHADGSKLTFFWNRNRLDGNGEDEEEYKRLGEYFHVFCRYGILSLRLRNKADEVGCLLNVDRNVELFPRPATGI